MNFSPRNSVTIRSLEYMDLMMYGFWGEGHTNDIPGPFPDYLTAEKTFLRMTQLQIDTWKKTPLAVNTEPDISNVRQPASAGPRGAFRMLVALGQPDHG